MLHQGIPKEAEWLIENIKDGSVESVCTYMKIRQPAYDFIEKIWSEYPPPIIFEESSEMASERDEDVSAIQEDDFTWYVLKNMHLIYLMRYQSHAIVDSWF
jgi:hypothetical protein